MTNLEKLIYEHFKDLPQEELLKNLKGLKFENYNVTKTTSDQLKKEINDLLLSIYPDSSPPKFVNVRDIDEEK